MKRVVRILLPGVIFAVTGVVAVKTCSLEANFRIYLKTGFWQPLARFVETRPSRFLNSRFAGMPTLSATGILEEVRREYDKISDPWDPLTSNVPAPRDGRFVPARNAVAAVLKHPALTEEQREEILLVDAKIDLREGEAGSPEALKKALDKLLAFSGSARNPAFTSEARGWLARAYYLQKNYAAAAKIYLDELSLKSSNHSKESLITSLRILFPYNGSSRRLADHLDEYFDTPSHALFVVNLVTNPVHYDEQEREAMAGIGQKVLATLQRHRTLFKSGAESGALAMASMRASLYMGNPAGALKYATLVPKDSPTSKDPEFCWMVACSHFLRREFAEAERPLVTVLQSKNATQVMKKAAAQGLMGVYQKTGKPVEQLHAAFLSSSIADDEAEGEMTLDLYWSRITPASGWVLDLPYLLDFQLSEKNLQDYLRRYPRAIVTTGRPRRSDTELVKYALAVRAARREDYETAAQLYKEIEARPRAARMRALAAIYAKTQASSLTDSQRLKAIYDYAIFLADHPVQVFFNDSLWHGFQTTVFIEPNRPYETELAQRGSGLTRSEREQLRLRERQVRDEQEERWRAYKILSGVAQKAGATDLGRRAARRSLTCLSMINTDRFGREEEIRAAMEDMQKWLRRNS